MWRACIPVLIVCSPHCNDSHMRGQSVRGSLKESNLDRRVSKDTLPLILQPAKTNQVVIGYNLALK